MACEYASQKQQLAEAKERRRLISRFSALDWLTDTNLGLALERYSGSPLLVDLGGDGLRAHNLLRNNPQLSVISVSLTPQDGFSITQVPRCPDRNRHRFVWVDAIGALRALSPGSLHAHLEISNVAENGDIENIVELINENLEIREFDLNLFSPITKVYLIAKYALKALAPGMSFSLEVLEPEGVLAHVSKKKPNKEQIMQFL